jgi:ATP-binding protein involved in chromosome partitioning
MSQATSPPPPGPEPEIDPLEQRLSQNLADIRHKLVVMSGKGGVGKSTVAAELAVGLSLSGYRVGLLDVDLHGPSIPRMLGIAGHAEVVTDEQLIKPVIIDESLKVISVELLMPDKDASVIWRGPMKIGVIRQLMGDVTWGALDFLIIDAPPGTGDEPLTVAQNVEGAKVVLVTTPQEIALADLRKSLDFCRKLELPVLGLVENMAGLVCPHCGGQVDFLGQGGGQDTASRFGLRFLSRLPWDPKLMAAADAGRLVSLLRRDWGEEAPYRGVVRETLGMLGERKA